MLYPMAICDTKYLSTLKTRKESKAISVCHEKVRVNGYSGQSSKQVAVPINYINFETKQ